MREGDIVAGYVDLPDVLAVDGLAVHEADYDPPKQSANSLFRFWKDPKWLFDAIEKNAMIPRYYPETVDYLDIDIFQIAYPMICFCDINFHKLGEHMKLYGGYGIAFSKQWGIQKGIQPLQYINKDSILCKDFSKAFRYALTAEYDDPTHNYMQTHMYYMKPIQGMMPRDGAELNKNFTDEREWRYIPNVSELDLPQAVIDDDMAGLENCNDTIVCHDACWLKFAPEDIKYIIVQTNEEFEKLCALIEGKSIQPEVKRKLFSRIVVWEESKEDF